MIQMEYDTAGYSREECTAIVLGAAVGELALLTAAELAPVDRDHPNLSLAALETGGYYAEAA